MFSRQNVHGKQTLLHHLLNIKRREAFPAVVIDSSQVSITLMNSKILIDKIQYFSWIFQEKGLIFTVSLLAKKILKKINGQLTYQKWWQENRLSPTDIRHHQAELKTWQYLPQISVVLPVYDVDILWLRKAIDSVVSQIYPHWQLCIADDASPNPEIARVLKRYQQQDSRIQVIIRTKNGNISAASNSALTLATGEYICLLDNDDELAVNALFEVAKLINQYPEADYIYSDEDHIDTRGNHCDPAFKPQWSPDFFHTQMYTCHLSTFRTQLVKEVGGFRSKFDGAQDYDLVLRISEKTQNIFHIPKVLYHWRNLNTSSASGETGKSWAFKVGEKALEEMLKRSDYPGSVEETTMAGVFRVRRHLLSRPLVSIIIPSAGKCIQTDEGDICLLEQCIHSIVQKSTYSNFEIVVVDGYDIAEPIISRLQDTFRLVRDHHPFNYARRINLGTEKAQGEILLLLNDDTQILTADWLESMLELTQQPEIGAVGAKLLSSDDRIQHTGVVLINDPLGNFCPSHVFWGEDSSEVGYSFSNVVNRNYLAVTAACLMVRKAYFFQVGGMDIAFPLNFNDVDFCLKLFRAGYRNVFTPYAQLNHYGSASRSDKQVGREEQEIFAKRWNDYLENLGGDPYYHPNFGANLNFQLTSYPS